jgi:hypothetical protein
MSFILSWSGYFSRKGWDPKAWAKANEITTYEGCVKRIRKMHVVPPTEEQFNQQFIDLSSTLLSKKVTVEESTQPSAKAKSTEALYVKVLKPEQKKLEKKKPAPLPAKRATHRRTVKKESADSIVQTRGTGTDSIIDSVKKKPTTKKTRSRKNVKSS